MVTSHKNQWLFYAIASGACASLNGVFAKLTTTQLTTAWATELSHLLGLEESRMATELVVRGVCIVQLSVVHHYHVADVWTSSSYL